MVRIWNSDTEQCVQVINTACTVAAVKLRCTHLAVGSFNASATLWTLSFGEMLGRYVGHTSAVFTVDFNLTLDLVVTGSADKTVILWSLANKMPLHAIQMTFKPFSVQFVFPSETLHRSDTFMLVANDYRQHEAWLVNIHNSNNVMVSDAKLPLKKVDSPVHCDRDTACNKLILAHETSSRIIEHCISFKSSEHVNKSNAKTSSSKEEPQSMLDVCCREFSVADYKDVMLLGAGSRFSVYVCQQGGLIVRHNSCSQSEFIGLSNMPYKCRCNTGF